MFKPKLPQQEQGFTLVEVLVAILITTVFVTVAMQAIVIAAVFKVRAQEFAEATIWIQEDLETVKNNAASLQYTSLAAPAAVGTSITVNSLYGFKQGDVLKVGTEFGKTIESISKNPINFTFNSALGTPKLINEIVVNTSRCGTAAIPATQSTGFADSLLDWLDDPQNGTDLGVTTKTKTLTKHSKYNKKKEFIFKRTTTVSKAPPFNLLEVSYDVSTNSVPPKSVAKLNTEVIPDAAFQCP